MANNLLEQVTSLKETLQTLQNRVSADETARKKLFQVVRDASLALEAPVDMFWRLTMTPATLSSIATLQQCGIITLLMESDTDMTADELGRLTGTDARLIVRLMRILTPEHIVEESGVETYKATPHTRLLGSQVHFSGFQFLFSCSVPSHFSLPAHLRKINYKNPSGPLGPFQTAKGTSDDLFAYLRKHPELEHQFHTFMQGHDADRVPWHSILPAREMILEGASSEQPLLVDVGGGRGHDIVAFKNAFPEVAGRLVLQDPEPALPIRHAFESGIVVQAHDFFQPQPVKAARAYYLHAILHNWADEQCLQILALLRNAMKPGYSKLFIHDFVFPSHCVPLHPAQIDSCMMSMFNAAERTESQWRVLLCSADMENITFHPVDPNGNSEDIIEVMI